MLRIEHQPVYCKVKKCRHRRKHEIYESKPARLIETHYTCAKKHVNINAKGKCTEA